MVHALSLRLFPLSEHWNYFGMDEALGPVAVSLRRDKLEEEKDLGQQYNYRLIFRTSEVSGAPAFVLRRVESLLHSYFQSAWF